MRSSPVADVAEQALFAHTRALVVLSPHPDDDVLGCGGAIAMAAATGRSVHVLYVTDGAASHPHSRAFPPERLRAVREAEARNALARLAPAARATFCAWPDATVPTAGELRARPLLARLRAELTADTLVLGPWRRDPHPDHRAVASLARMLVAERRDLRYAEYFVWLGERGTPADEPETGEGACIDLDIAPFVAAKVLALAEHRSQLGVAIHDTGAGFVLPAGVVARAAASTERFVLG